MNFRNLITINLILLVFLLFFNDSFISFAQQDSKATEKIDPPPETPTALLDAIQQRNKELDKKSGQIAVREKQLQELKNEIARMLEKNSQIMTAIDKQKKDRNEKEEELFQRLAKVYQSMEPEEASKRIEKLKDPLALEILSRIKPKSVAAILTGMDPTRAARYSEKLSQVKE